MSDTLQLVGSAMGGGLVALAPVAVAWLRERGRRGKAHGDRVQHLEGDTDKLRAELKTLITDSAKECDAKVDAKVREAITASEAGCAELLAASEERSATRVTDAEARADRLIGQLTQALTRAGSLAPDDTGVHEVEATIRAGRQRRSTPRSWPAADPDEESGGER